MPAALPAAVSPRCRKTNAATSCACIYQWTHNDYQAAMRWAVSRPLGEDREQVLKIIHGNWPEDDPEGKDGFVN
jgi:hypothetical protein